MSASAISSNLFWRSPALFAPLGVGCAVVAFGLWLCLPQVALLSRAASTTDEPATAATANATSAADEQRAPVDLHALGDSALFGMAEPVDAAAGAADPNAAGVADPVEFGDAPPAELPVATLGVTVQGIVFEPGSGAGRVIFGGAGGAPRSYRVGDELPDGVVIRFIEARRVVVEQAGELKSLPLPSLHGGAPLVHDLPTADEFDPDFLPEEAMDQEEFEADPGAADYE